MVDFRGNIIAEVLGFDVYPSSKKGRLVVITSVLQTEDRSEIENNRNILVKVRLLAEIKNGGTEFRNNEVKVGTQMELETNGTALKGIIRKIGFSQEDIKEKLVKKTVGVKMYLQMPVIANSIIIGSTESSNEGKVMAKILDKKVEPAKIVAIRYKKRHRMMHFPILRKLQCFQNITCILSTIRSVVTFNKRRVYRKTYS